MINMTHSTSTLLIELLTEELPPKALLKLATAFSQLVGEELVKLGFLAHSTPQVYATPRRLALTFPAVHMTQPAQQIERRGPAVAQAFKEGEPTPALLGFARACGVNHTELEKAHDGKQAIFMFRRTDPGISLAHVLPKLVENALKKLPVPKMMRWGGGEEVFIRPIHGLILLHGDQLIAGTVLGVASQQTTLGHRFLSAGKLFIAQADDYADTLYKQGKVIASFAARRQAIQAALEHQAHALQASLVPAPALLDEVTALVEWPAVYHATFAAEFLAVPQECLILSMQQHQRYFALLDNKGKLMPQFLLVANIAPADPSAIIQGNERVLRARLADAQFFYRQDKKHTLASRVPKLAEVVYHNKLGSQLERVTRLQDIAGTIAELLGADRHAAARAAYLAKADLLTDMVGEFPELQGIMGMYYAQHDGEAQDIAQAIALHYQPRFSGDDLPEGAIAQALALADKLESLVGMYGIGMIPTGDKDPFGLRRAALGVTRLLLRLPLDLQTLLEITVQHFSGSTLSPTVVKEVYNFIHDRLKNYLSQDYPVPHIEAVLAASQGRFDRVLPKLAAVAQFIQLPEAKALAGANKRIHNLLKKNTHLLPQLDPNRLVETAEKTLFAALTALTAPVTSALSNQDYTTALKTLAGLRQPVDHFFEQVMVMTDDQTVRDNRLALLALSADLMNQTADLSYLTESSG
jgi:glycyl-tRNA synthetase beta chain